MAYIGKQPIVGNFVKLDTITTSATTTFNLTSGGVAYSPQSANNCIVSLNGVIQAPTSAYTISGSTIVFDSALTAADVIDFILVLGDVLNIGTPSDNTVTTAKLADSAVTTAKITDNAVTTAKITDSAVTTAKLATGITTTHGLGSASTPSITFTGDTNTGIFSPTADTIAFTEGGSEAMRINSSGNVQFAGNIGLGGTSPTTSGTGISFPATASGSSDANTLDDYEEGTWTPDVLNNGSYTSWGTKQGSYIKVGSYVTFWFMCDNGTSNGGSGNGPILLTLPFQITTNQNYMHIGSYIKSGANYPNAIVLVGGNNTIVQFWNLTSGTNQDTNSFSFVTGFIIARVF
jgi:hypothetical protein